MSPTRNTETDLKLVGGANMAPVEKPEPTPNPILAELITAENYRDIQPLQWFVPGWIIQGGTTAIYGDPGAGKSFWALGLALQAARGGQWADHDFRTPRRVLYLAPEAAQSHVERIKGWLKMHGTHWPDTFSLSPTQTNIYTDQSVSDIEQALEMLGSVDLVIVDTLAAASPTVDENGSEMKVVTQNLERIRRAMSPGAPLLIVHHAGKDSTKGMRGHSSLFGYVSGSILITKENNTHKVTPKKVRDGSAPAPLYFRIEPVQLPPLPGDVLAREVGVMVPTGFSDTVKDDVTTLCDALAQGYRIGDIFGPRDVQDMELLPNNRRKNALKTGTELGLWTREGNTRNTHYVFRGRPSDVGSLIEQSDTTTQDTLPDLGNLI
jgi:hypothetical protein